MVYVLSNVNWIDYLWFKLIKLEKYKITLKKNHLFIQNICQIIRISKFILNLFTSSLLYKVSLSYKTLINYIEIFKFCYLFILIINGIK